MEKNIRARRWCFTINNPQEEDRDKITGIRGTKYLIYGNEIAPETGTPHLQGYIVFNQPKAFKTLQNHVPRAHWEKAKKGHAANVRYCTKSNDIYEMGDRPHDEKYDKEKIDMAELKKNPIKGYQSITGKYY